MTINKRLLATLVRLTAINAHRCIRYNTEGYDRPFFNRYNLIQEVINKCTKKLDFSNYLLSGFQSDTSNVAGAGSKDGKTLEKSNAVDVRTPLESSAGASTTPTTS